MKKNKLAPSILNADFSCIKEVLKFLEENRVDLIHLDVMDGNFVPNISFGPMIVKTIRKNTFLPLSVHLMIDNPERYIDSFAEDMKKDDVLIVHVEACKHLDKTLETINNLGIKSGIALNPATPPEVARYIVDKINTILIMTVNPGFGGQEFIQSMIPKIIDTKKFVKQNKKEIKIQVDGGVNKKNINSLIEAGADIFVVGSEIFTAESPEKIIKDIKKILEE